MPSPGFLAERVKWFSALAFRPDPARSWWIWLSPDRRRSLLTHAGHRADLAAAPWDALPEKAQASLRLAHHKRAAMFSKLAPEFLPFNRQPGRA